MFPPDASQKQLRNPWSILCWCRAGWVEPPNFPGSPRALAVSLPSQSAAGRVAALCLGCSPATACWVHVLNVTSVAQMGSCPRRPRLCLLGTTAASAASPALAGCCRSWWPCSGHHHLKLWAQIPAPCMPEAALGQWSPPFLPGSAGCSGRAWTKPKPILVRACDLRHVTSYLLSAKQTRGAGRAQRVSS